jgi:hypothetical protein
MNRLSAILGLFAIAAVSALIGARAQVIDWVPFEPAPSEFPRELSEQLCHAAAAGLAPRANPPGQRIGSPSQLEICGHVRSGSIRQAGRTVEGYVRSL